jgi:MOSC domain-containing protein YiiM
VKAHKTDMSGQLLAIAWKSKPRQPMLSASASFVTVENGIAGDFRGQPGARQVTVLFAEDWRAACAELGADLDWTARRANLFVEGLTNPRSAGGRLRIGSVVLAITGETDPCSNMDRAYQGLRAALTPNWRGGLTARVVEGGPIAIGDAVAWRA